ncbi:single-stranded DNA-binding protein [Dethiosulfovibrio salsuginis]|uniref:Single-stranded DNA-binding protein n=1 Tax=Dethiosulfovibrio salsuginis TaxID=561720 RepID=A0A1X7J2R2_9BACT|nr:single-stranded DNA-binding protein [Dethiosulfovibrio salsuginis]SMG21512.1 single-strand DNA-binding protein [Dethiosulfovibrio salsuginis]
MARGFNKVILMGNLAKDPQIRYTATKQAVASFSVAVNRSWKGKNGELQESVDFIPVVVWGPQAENCERYLSKGSGILLEGRIQVRSYDDKTGQKRWVTEVVAADITFLPSSGGRKDDRPSSRGDYERKSSPAGYGGEPRSFRDDFGGGGDFPMDISEMGSSADDDETDIPF